jgi:hypothetical protein
MRNAKLVQLTVLAAGVAVAFVAGSLVPAAWRTASAQQAPGVQGSGTVSSNNRFIAATGSVGSGMSVLWLVDTDGKRVLVYGTNNLGKDIELRAARNIEWDLRLDEYMDDSQYKAEDLKRLAERRHQSSLSVEPEKPATKEGAK